MPPSLPGLASHGPGESPADTPTTRTSFLCCGHLEGPSFCPFPSGTEGPARPVEGSGAANISWVPQSGRGHVLLRAGVRSGREASRRGRLLEA